MTRLIANNIKKCREGSNLSQQALADHIHVSRQTISNWERGVSQPDLDSLILLAEEFHVDVEEVIYGEKPLDVFQATRSKRIKYTILLGLISAVLLVLCTYLLPFLYAHIHENLVLYSSAKASLLPVLYGTSSAFILSLISIWVDFRISLRFLRFTLLATAISTIVLYCVFMVVVFIGGASYTSFNQIPAVRVLFNWFLDHPVIFIFPGAMLFCGFNKNPDPSQPDPQPVQEVDAV